MTTTEPRRATPLAVPLRSASPRTAPLRHSSQRIATPYLLAAFLGTVVLYAAAYSMATFALTGAP